MRVLEAYALAHTLEHAVGERDDEHLAGRVLEHVVDGRREEARLAPPARRRAEHDQVGAAALGLVDDRVADRAGVDGVGMDLDAVLLAERLRLGDRRRSALRDLGRQLGVERALPRHRHDGDRLDPGPALLRERDGCGDHLLADVAELHRHEDAPEGGAHRERAARIDVLEDMPRRSCQRVPTNTASPSASHAGPAYRAPSCVTIASTKTAAVSGAPTSAGSGTSTPRIRTSGRARNGRPRSGSRRRSRITASCASVNASRTPKE